ncbi:DinB family protein [Actinopolymorpha rutila]|uniref:Putative damage-inducible protein DinB n=1 Tax=Actinopolymorpha rutila TaxID=446787 RepID=A0A852ZCZ4_9ACTN|nr:DinB family protein [Actinopolymorpha rutila]NYH90774.1 putative damage-inducible protein DinB [Actinopolymorpha rutila]
MTTATSTPLPDEHSELLRALAEQRELLLITVRGVTDAQARQRTTVSELTLGGIVRHLATAERVWARIMVTGDGELPDGMLDTGQYRMAEQDSLASLLESYATAAAGLQDAVGTMPDLGRTVLLPTTPWSPPEPIHWPVRRVLLHLIRETAQHAGHADIIREALDGASTTARR